MSPTINTSIIIAAPPSVVRKEFLDFDSYPQWNPFITSMKSATPTPEKGTHLTFVGNGTTIKPVVVENTPERFSWLGQLLGEWFFAGHHLFQFEPSGDMGENGETVACKLVQKENFGGVAAGLLLRFVGSSTEKGFNAMNAALKARVEGKQEVK
jgi:hypothetical protein